MIKARRELSGPDKAVPRLGGKRGSACIAGSEMALRDGGAVSQCAILGRRFRHV
jgi:hypothetical protein